MTNKIAFHKAGPLLPWCVQSLMNPEGKRPRLPITTIGDGLSPYGWEVDMLSDVVFGDDRNVNPFSIIESVQVTASDPTGNSIRFTLRCNDELETMSYEDVSAKDTVRNHNPAYERIKEGQGMLEGPTKNELQTLWLTQQLTSIPSRSNFVPFHAIKSTLRLDGKGTRWLIGTMWDTFWVLDTSSKPHAEMVVTQQKGRQTIYIPERLAI